MHNSLIVITCSFTTVHNTVHRCREQKVLMLRTFMPSLRISFSMRSARRFLTAVLTDNIWQRVVTTVWLIVYSWGCLNANGVSTYSCVSAVACLASVDVTSVLLDDSSVESTTMTELGESVLQCATALTCLCNSTRICIGTDKSKGYCSFLYGVGAAIQLFKRKKNGYRCAVTANRNTCVLKGYK